MTEKELQMIYDSIMNKEIEKAKELIDSMYFTRSQVLRYLNDFTKTKSLDEQQLYMKNYDFFLTSYSNYFKIAFSLINELIKTGTVNFEDYSSFCEVKQALNQFKNRFSEYKCYIDDIMEIIKISEEETKKSSKINDFYNQYNDNRTKYEDEFYVIATSENPVAVFKSYNWTDKEFYQKLGYFKKKYPEGEDNGLAEKFEKWFNQYITEYKRTSLSLNFEYRKDQLSVAKSVIEDLIESDKSIYEYCHSNLGYTYAEIKNYIRGYFGEYRSNMPRTREFIQMIESRENPRFINELNHIVEQIMYDENYTVIDYYLDTKLDIVDFMKKTNIKNASISQFAAQNFDSAYSFGKEVWRRNLKEFNKQQELKVTRIIKGRLIISEEKEAIFKYFEENEIPLNNYTYHAALGKLANSDLDFTSKINTYKKGSF